jgi:hypothetical protein
LEHIERLLRATGDSPDAVAATLRAAGVRGMRDSTSFMNPLVRHVNRSLSVGGRLEVGAGGDVLRLLMKNRVREVAIPLPVQVFLDGFHRGLYLEGP